MVKHVVGGVALVLGCVASLAWAAPGEYWEITNKVEMQGMSMPGMTQKVCMPKGGEKDPRNSADKDCQMTDMKASGNKSSWKMRCDKNGEVMTGSGEMTTSSDRTEGTINITTAKSGSMTMSFVNKRLGGACDSDELKKKFEAQAAAANAQQAKMCDGLTTNREWLARSSMILGKDAVCAAKKDQFCELMQRDSGRDVDVYFTLKKSDGSVSKGCGISMDAAKKSLCKSVDANNRDFGKQLRGGMGAMYTQSLRSECPAEMKTYAEVSRKRYCEGRGFTEKQQVTLANCLKGASGEDEAMNTPDPEEPEVAPQRASSKKAGNQPGNQSEAASTDAANADQSTAGKLLNGLGIPSLPGGGNSTDAVIDGAKKLKSLFGF
jgi:hypothetical protein